MVQSNFVDLIFIHKYIISSFLKLSFLDKKQ